MLSGAASSWLHWLSSEAGKETGTGKGWPQGSQVSGQTGWSGALPDADGIQPLGSSEARTSQEGAFLKSGSDEGGESPAEGMWGAGGLPISPLHRPLWTHPQLSVHQTGVGAHCTPLSNQPSEPPGRIQRRCCRLIAKGCREKEDIPRVQGHRQASDGRRVGGDAAGARETQ